MNQLEQEWGPVTSTKKANAGYFTIRRWHSPQPPNSISFKVIWVFPGDDIVLDSAFKIGTKKAFAESKAFAKAIVDDQEYPEIVEIEVDPGFIVISIDGHVGVGFSVFLSVSDMDKLRHQTLSDLIRSIASKRGFKK